MPHPLPLNLTQGPVACKLLSNQLYRIVQEKARKSTVGAEIERHCNRCASLEGKLVEMRKIRRNFIALNHSSTSFFNLTGIKDMYP